jgi:hypothetical protein
MASTLAVGFGIATAAFLVSPVSVIPMGPKTDLFSLRAAPVWSPTAVPKVASTLQARLSSKGSFDALDI